MASRFPVGTGRDWDFLLFSSFFFVGEHSALCSSIEYKGVKPESIKDIDVSGEEGKRRTDCYKQTHRLTEINCERHAVFGGCDASGKLGRGSLSDHFSVTEVCHDESVETAAMEEYRQQTQIPADLTHCGNRFHAKQPTKHIVFCNIY